MLVFLGAHCESRHFQLCLEFTTNKDIYLQQPLWQRNMEALLYCASPRVVHKAEIPVSGQRDTQTELMHIKM